LTIARRDEIGSTVIVTFLIFRQTEQKSYYNGKSRRGKRISFDRISNKEIMEKVERGLKPMLDLENYCN